MALHFTSNAVHSKKCHSLYPKTNLLRDRVSCICIYNPHCHLANHLRICQEACNSLDHIVGSLNLATGAVTFRYSLFHCCRQHLALVLWCTCNISTPLWVRSIDNTSSFALCELSMHQCYRKQSGVFFLAAPNMENMYVYILIEAYGEHTEEHVESECKYQN